MKNEKSSRHSYESYLLRLWRDGAQMPWRAALQSTTTAQTYHFVTVDALIAFLEEDTVTANNDLNPMSDAQHNQDALSSGSKPRA